MRERSPRGSGACAFVGLDFDCTITVRHFYKCIAAWFAKGWQLEHEANLLMGKPFGHPHCADFTAWLKKEGVKLEDGPQRKENTRRPAGALWERFANSLTCIGALPHAILRGRVVLRMVSAVEVLNAKLGPEKFKLLIREAERLFVQRPFIRSSLGAKIGLRR